MNDYQTLTKNGNSYVVYKDGFLNSEKWGLYKVKWAGGNELISLHDSKSEAVSAL